VIPIAVPNHTNSRGAVSRGWCGPVGPFYHYGACDRHGAGEQDVRRAGGRVGGGRLRPPGAPTGPCGEWDPYWVWLILSFN